MFLCRISTSFYVSRRRLMYAYELFVNHNKALAQKQLSAFEKAAKSYPYAAEVESEREIISYLNKKSEDLLLI